jgi:cytidylate kinase
VSGIVIAIDGPVGSGKSTVARRVAELLGYAYLDTGAMYRAVALKAMRRGIPLDSKDRIAAVAAGAEITMPASRHGQGPAVYLDGVDVTEAIRAPEVAQAASKVAALPEVRAVLVPLQRLLGQAGGVVMEGRDIGTVVFPGAALKIFLTASVDVRARRRLREFELSGRTLDPAAMIEDVEERDRRDTQRQNSPLLRAPDAVVIDSSAMESEDVARTIAMLANAKCAEAKP